jgi:hypothetical protein
MSDALAPLISGELRRIEIAIDDHTLVRLTKDDLALFLSGVELIVDRACAMGLTIARYRDVLRMSDIITITRPD